MRNWFALPARSTDAEPRSLYTFRAASIRGGQSGHKTRPSGTAYVLNSIVVNRRGNMRYTVISEKKYTTIMDRDGEEVARVEWDHLRYPCIKYRRGDLVRCKDWIPYGKSRLTRIVRAKGNAYRWTRVEGEDSFTPTRGQIDQEAISFAKVNDNHELEAAFVKSARDRKTKDAFIVALVLLHGENRWLNLGQFGAEDVKRMKIALRIVLGVAGLGRAVAGAI